MRNFKRKKKKKKNKQNKNKTNNVVLIKKFIQVANK